MEWVLAGFKLLTGILDPVSKITSAIADEKIQLARNTTESERIASQERIATMQAQRDVAIANATTLGKLGRDTLFWTYVIYNMKLVIWDKMLGWGTTDGLSEHMQYVEMVVLGGYFIHDAIKNKSK